MASQTNLYVERALFIIGEPGTGKSPQLRTMFRDLRLSKEGAGPMSSGNLPDSYPLSNERWLYLRLSSPHESTVRGKPESIRDFLKKCEKKMWVEADGGRRWNFAGALQPTATKNMPDAVTTIKKFNTRFKPERVRAVLFYPDQPEDGPRHQEVLDLLSELLKLQRTEAIVTDRRNWDGNGLIYADFFDFT